MDYWPNVEGALWFASEVLPLVKRQIANAQFYVVGAQPANALRNISATDVQVTGEVADVRPFIAAQQVSLWRSPLRIARGVQNKVLEALAMRVPIVATEEASRGLAVVSGRDLWVANAADEFRECRGGRGTFRWPRCYRPPTVGPLSRNITTGIKCFRPLKPLSKI